MYRSDEDKGKVRSSDILGMAGVTFLAVALVVILIIGVIAGFKAFGRYQRVADARNQEKVIEMEVKQTAMLVEVEKQKAAVRIEEAKGISESQRIINNTLTPNYLTYLSIQAQMNHADSPNTTVIYIPVGENGVPIVRDSSADEAPTPE
jgi:hypothetical protein